ncbi:hypothetical protein PAMP_000220 [Pampus punctatissimus]
MSIYSFMNLMGNIIVFVQSFMPLAPGGMCKAEKLSTWTEQKCLYFRLEQTPQKGQIGEDIGTGDDVDYHDPPPIHMELPDAYLDKFPKLPTVPAQIANCVCWRAGGVGVTEAVGTVMLSVGVEIRLTYV